MANDFEIISEEPVPVSRWKPILKWIRKAAAVLGILTVLLFLVATVLLVFFEDEIKQAALDRLNKQLNTEIKVDEINVSIIRKFPYASIELKNVRCPEVYPRNKKQTLFSAGSVFLQFNIWDLFYKNYKVKKISVKNGEINLFRDEQGLDNWHFWKPNESDTVEADFSFRLSSVLLENVKATYIDERELIELAIIVDEINLSGNFSDERFKLTTEGNFSCKRFIRRGSSYLQDSHIHFSTTLNVDSKSHVYHINYGEISLDDLKMNLSGSITGKEKSWLLDLSCSGKDMNIRSILSLLPKELREIRREYDSDGNFYFRATVKGIFGNRLLPQIDSEFGIENGSIRHSESNSTMKQVFLKGAYSNGGKQPQHSYLKIEGFRGYLPNSSLTGSFYLYSFNHPEIHLKTSSELDLSEIFRFLPLDTLENLSGNLSLNLEFKGKPADGKQFTGEDFAAAYCQGEAQLKDVNILIKNHPHPVSDVSGFLFFNNRNVKVQELYLIYGGCQFLLNGSAENLTGYLLDETQRLNIQAAIQSPHLDLNRFLSGNKKESDKSEISFPPRIDWNLTADLRKVSFDAFEALNVKGEINLNHDELSARKVTLQSMDGSLSLDGILRPVSESDFMMAAYGKIENISIKKLFTAFDNFGQSTLTDKNVNGTASVVYEFKTDISKSLKINKESLYSRNSVIIDKGELNQFEPLARLSKWVRLEELAALRFSRLQNQVVIENQKIVLPEMNIQTSSLDLNLSGIHGFDNAVDYRFNIHLYEILAAKFRMKNNKQSEFGDLYDEKEGKLRLFVHMFGHTDSEEGLTFEYDTKMVGKKILNDLKKEKSNIREIIRSDFNIQRNDSILKNDPWMKRRALKRDSIRKKTENDQDWQIE